VTTPPDAERGLRRLHRPVIVDRIVYATITMMSVLIIYDGWQNLRLIDVVGVIVGPVLAMFVAHVFSAAMAQHVEVARILTRREWGDIIRMQAPFLLLCVPPLGVIILLIQVFLQPGKAFSGGVALG
jgi:hypothetical protein